MAASQHRDTPDSLSSACGAIERHRHHGRKSRHEGSAPKSFNYMIGAEEERLRDGQAEGAGSLEVDDELECARLLDW
jgi:hypothetical protein